MSKPSGPWTFWVSLLLFAAFTAASVATLVSISFVSPLCRDMPLFQHILFLCRTSVLCVLSSFRHAELKTVSFLLAGTMLFRHI
uniref:Serine protease inhibitor n=1 Tax=Rhipicephalus zambeziensis TaxID=60191 RepID=A0A224YER7_9ACAR